MAERGFSSTLQTALSSPEAGLALLVYLDWVGGAVRAWTGVGDLAWDSHTWTGVGELGGIDKIADSVSGQDIGVEVSLNYLNDALRNEVLTNDSVGRDAAIYLAAVSSATRAVADAYPLFIGYIGQNSIEDSGATGRITIRLESELAKLQRVRSIALSNAHQQWLFPGDLGCEWAAIMDEPILWGRKGFLPTTLPQPVPDPEPWNPFIP